ncbi:MAG: NfeD family protein [Flavobacteriales bacterium]|jgi:membrane protein implicated in regulation of membrane protease activity|nr:NfeD family protein [Flavobacteriales bacterium]
MELWHILAALAFLMFIAEIVLPAFIVGTFGLGFLCAAAGAWLGLSNSWLFALFSAGTLLAFFTIRPLILKWGNTPDKKISTNSAALIGRTARVVQTIVGEEGGRVVIDGDEWKAVAPDGQTIKENQYVVIKDIDSIVLIVALKNE